MKFYLSGLKGRRELNIAKFGGKHVLLDPFQAKNVPDGYPVEDRMMDSGAYRTWKTGATLSTYDYAEIAHSYPWTHIVAPDVIGDPVATRENWMAMRELTVFSDLIDRTIPVWHWKSDWDLLDRYLDEAETVGIGGLVDPLRKKRDADDPKDEERKRDRVLRELVRLCEKYPGRFHVFGLCWPKAITALNDLIASADSSLWLWGAKYGDVLSIRKSRNGRRYLTSSKWWHHDEFRDVDWSKVPHSRSWTLCVENISMLKEFTQA